MISLLVLNLPDLILNQLNGPKIRLCKALQFLTKNSSEKQITTAKIYKIKKRILSNTINRKINPYYSGQNKILTESQEATLYTFIKDWLEYSQLLIYYILFGIICRL